MYSAERERLEKLAIEELKKLQKLKKERIIKKKNRNRKNRRDSHGNFEQTTHQEISQPLKY